MSTHSGDMHASDGHLIGRKEMSDAEFLAPILDTRESLLAELEAVCATAEARRDAAQDPFLKGIRPAATDWMSAEEIAHYSDIQARLVPFRETAADAQARVDVKRAARVRARKLGSDAARAVGRFRPEGVEGYRASSPPDAPLRATRREAEWDELLFLEQTRCVIKVCAECGELVSDAEQERLALDIDFVPHGDRGHLIRIAT